MGRRITEKVVTSSGGGGQDFNDPFEQPCFTSYTGQYNHSTGFFTWDHNLNRHQWVHGDTQQSADYRSDNSSYATEFIQEQGSSQWFNTQSQPGGSTDRPNLCSYTGYLGHSCFVNASRTGGATAWFTRSPGSDRRSYAFRDVGTLPGETHQDYAIYCQFGGTFRIGQRSSTEYFAGVNSTIHLIFLMVGEVKCMVEFLTTVRRTSYYSWKRMMVINISHGFGRIALT